MPHRVPSVLTACALTFGAGSALAQAPEAAKPASATAVSPLTVQGAAPPKTIEKQAWSVVQVYAAATPKLGLIGRWREPICVQVVNLAPEQAALVQARVEEVAKGVGLAVSKAGCKANVQIVLSSQSQAFVDKVAKADENTLGFHYPSDLARVKTVTHPIQAWYKTATQGSKVGHDGLPFANLKFGMAANPITQVDVTNPGSLAGESHEAETVDIPDNGSPPGCAGSLINHCERSVFKNVLVVVDSHAVEGKDLGAVADYVALLALSQASSVDGCNALPSILDLMAKSPCPGRDPPNELTPADASYLTALYASDPETRAASQRVDIAGRMAQILINAHATARASKEPTASPRAEPKGG